MAMLIETKSPDTAGGGPGSQNHLKFHDTTSAVVVNLVTPVAKLAGEINAEHEPAQRSSETAVKYVSARPWRDVLQVHPAAALFPLFGIRELGELADDIAEHGLAERIVYTGTPGAYIVLDGRNRLDALAGCLDRAIVDDHGHPLPEYFEYREHIPDVTAWIISKNIRRRHLDPKQKRELIAKVLSLTPEKSNRAVAKTIGVDHKTVAAVRANAERTGEIPQLKKTTGTDGKSRPAKKKTALKPSAKITLQAPTVTPKATAATVHTADHDVGHGDDDVQPPVHDVGVAADYQPQVLAQLLDAWDVATPVTRMNFITKARIHDKSMNMLTDRITNRKAAA